MYMCFRFRCIDFACVSTFFRLVFVTSNLVFFLGGGAQNEATLYVIWDYRYQFYECRNHSPSSFITYYGVCDQINTTGATSGVVTAYPPKAPQFNSSFQWRSYYLICSFLCSVLQIVVCPSVLFLLAIVLSVLLRFTASDYTFGIFQFFFLHCITGFVVRESLFFWPL